ncbi:MAG TPA: IS66 family transposase [Vicinamibacteria bacterium]|nr:IS66 family transposase [Vicinamibacteria bacterium]
MAAVTCPGCLERDERIAALEARVAELEALVRDLTARLGGNATNSSLPPSANPPGAPRPAAKKPTGNKPGGQPAHPAHLKRRLPADRVNAVVRLVPEWCSGCAGPLPAEAGPADPEPTWHQVAELPPLAAVVTEYQGHYRTCPCCGTLNHAAVPAGLKAHSVGPRLAATLAYLAGSHRVSKRGLEEITEDVFGVPVALGTIAHLETQVSAALAPAHAEALAAVRQADVKHVDETGWKVAGAVRWLWAAATGNVAVFLVHARRGWQALAALLGEKVQGIVCSDRWSAYGRLSPFCRQVCWAHLKRDFQKLVDRGGPAARLGQRLQRLTEQVFDAWHLFRGGGCDRAGLQRRLDGPARDLERVLRAGRRCACTKAATFCGNLLGLLPALWRFVVTDGVEPTNNHAERVLRRGVLWRKSSFGCRSEAGCRFVERLLTAVQTLRLQGRSVLGYLYRALVAHRNGLPAPSLLTTD